MAIRVLTNAKLWLDAYDLSGDSNELRMQLAADAIDVTTFGSGGTHKRAGGLQKVALNAAGLFQAGAAVAGVSAQQVDDTLFSLLNLNDKTISFADNGAEGDAGYFFQSILGLYTPGAAIGQALKYTMQAESRGTPLLRGTVMTSRLAANPVVATINTPSNAGLQLGAASATQKLYAALHVFDPVKGTSPTLNVVVQSSVDNTFAAPTARITFTQAVAKGAQYATAVVGPITDTWYRIALTIGGTGGPSFPCVVVVAIQ